MTEVLKKIATNIIEFTSRVEYFLAGVKKEETNLRMRCHTPFCHTIGAPSVKNDIKSNLFL